MNQVASFKLNYHCSVVKCFQQQKLVGSFTELSGAVRNKLQHSTEALVPLTQFSCFEFFDKPQCRPWDLQETDVNVCAVIEKDTWHFFKSHACLYILYTTPSWNLHENLSYSCSVELAEPVFQLKLICGLWLLSDLIHSHCSCPGCCIPLPWEQSF